MLKPGKNRRYVILAALLIFMAGVLAFHGHLPSVASELPGRSINPSTIASTGPQVGEASPNFTLPDTTGKTRSLSSFRGEPVVLGFFCGCDRCHAAALAIAHEQRQGKLTRFVAVVAMDADSAKSFGRGTGLHATILVDPSDKTAEAYESDFCPRLWHITAAGRIVYKSAAALDGSDLNQTLAALSQRTMPNVVGTQVRAHD